MIDPMSYVAMIIALKVLVHFPAFVFIYTATLRTAREAACRLPVERGFDTYGGASSNSEPEQFLRQFMELY